MTTVLIIDDNHDLRISTQAILKYGGYDVLEASDGDEGLAMVRRHLPDIILSDIIMPTMDGYDLIEALQDDTETATIPVIFLTALSEEHAVRQGMTLGADDYIVKPAKPEELLARIETRLRKQARIADKHDNSLNELRKNIVYALPHEMRTPLQLILGFAEVIEFSDETTSLDEMIQYGQSIKQAGYRLERIIENHLVYAQLEVLAADPAEREALRNHEIEHADAVIKTTARQQATTQGRENDFHYRLEPVTLNISEENLVKIIVELVDNAMKFSDAGTPIQLEGAWTEDGYTICIEDQGRGLDATSIQQIGAYMQFDRAIYEQGGLGLGLIIVKRLVELHEGQMIVDSQPEEGTRIRFVLPGQ